MAATNETYVSMYDTLDKAILMEAQLQSALESSERNEELQKQMEAAEASRVKEFARMRDAKEKLEGELQDIRVTNAVYTNKVSALEARS